MKTTSRNFKDIQWGADEAKGDKLLETYFVRIPEYDALLNGDYRYVIGRKGTGKTAIIQRIIAEAESNYNFFYKYLSLKDFPIQDLREFAARGMNHKARYVPIWTFLIAIELCKLIIEDNSICEQEEVLELKKFISTNFPQQIGFAETIEVLTNNGKEVKVALSWLQGGCSSETSINTMVPIHYQKITDILLNYIKQVNTDSIYFLLFDELDEGYKKGDKNLNLLLLALLRAVENTALQFSDSHIQYRPVLALRTDIFNSLEDNDLNKLDDYIIHLKWTQEYGSPYSLRDLVNARINASIHTANPMDPWGCVVYDSDPALKLYGNMYTIKHSNAHET